MDFSVRVVKERCRGQSDDTHRNKSEHTNTQIFLAVARNKPFFAFRLARDAAAGTQIFTYYV